jgi:tryptophanase
VGYDSDREIAIEIASRIKGVLVATSASKKAGMVSMGGIVRDTSRERAYEAAVRYSITTGSREEQNTYTADLEAMAMALRRMPDVLYHRQVTFMTSNRSALEAIST